MFVEILLFLVLILLVVVLLGQRKLKIEFVDLKKEIKKVNAENESVDSAALAFSKGDMEELIEEAKEIIIEYQKASAALLQRKLRIGYARAAAVLDQLEEQGYVGPPRGAEPREVLVEEDLDE